MLTTIIILFLILLGNITFRGELPDEQISARYQKRIGTRGAVSHHGDTHRHAWCTKFPLFFFFFLMGVCVCEGGGNRKAPQWILIIIIIFFFNFFIGKGKEWDDRNQYYTADTGSESDAT